VYVKKKWRAENTAKGVISESTLPVAAVDGPCKIMRREFVAITSFHATANRPGSAANVMLQSTVA